jgi:hypothetical protein
MNESGRTLVEMVVAAGIASVLAVFTLRQVRAASVDSHLLGAGYVFKGEFRKARSMAARNSVYTAIRFEEKAAIPKYSVYIDGNLNGVRKEDIAKGIDRRVAGPFFLDAQAPGVRVGINPGTPAIPPTGGSSTCRTPSGSAARTCSRSRRWERPRPAPSTWRARPRRPPCASRPAPRASG